MKKNKMQKENINETNIEDNASAEITEKRFFFVTTVGQAFNNSTSYNSFDIITNDGKYPTFKKCLDTSNERYKNLHSVALMSISEIPAKDWAHFVSEQ